MSFIKNKYDLIRCPLITEKANDLAEYSKYTFKVSSFATKKSVKNVVEDIFEVKVKSVNILNKKGKAKLFKGRKGRRSDIKKAVVTLEQSYSIDFAGGVS